MNVDVRPKELIGKFKELILPSFYISGSGITTRNKDEEIYGLFAKDNTSLRLYLEFFHYLFRSGYSCLKE